MNEGNTFQPILVTVKARPVVASQRTKNRCSLARESQMWLDNISHPIAWVEKNAGYSKALADSMVQSKAASKWVDGLGGYHWTN